jgi:hypothetical protein
MIRQNEKKRPNKPQLELCKEPKTTFSTEEKWLGRSTLPTLAKQSHERLYSVE